MKIKDRWLWRRLFWFDWWSTDTSRSWIVLVPWFALHVFDSEYDYFSGERRTGWRLWWKRNPEWNDVGSTTFCKKIGQEQVWREDPFKDIFAKGAR